MSDASASAAESEPIRTREVGWATIALFLVVSIALLTAFAAVLRLGPLSGVIIPSWLENLATFSILLLVAVGGVLFGIGRLRPSDLGLGREKIVQAIVVIGAIWISNQLLGGITELATTPALRFDRAWSTGAGRVLLWTLVMFFATALYEEIGFRGFLYPQLFLKLPGSPRARFWTALLVSQLIFAAMHIPAHLIIRHMSGGALLSVLARQLIAGILLLLIYLRTRNLGIAIGLHGLANAPTPLFAGTLSWEIFLIALFVGWPWITRRPEDRGLARIVQTDPG